MACCEPSDVIIQTSHQSQCYRIVQLHADSSLHAFPNNGFGVKVCARLIIMQYIVDTALTGSCLTLLSCSHVADICPETL